MSRALASVVGAGLWWWVAATSSVAAMPGWSLSGELAADAERSHTLELQAGDFVTGEIRGRGMRLVLRDAQGQHLRGLTRGQWDVDSFMFVAPRHGRYALAVHALEGGAYQVAVDPPVERARQRVPTADTPLDSPFLRDWQGRLAASSGEAATGVADPGTNANTNATTNAATDAFWDAVRLRGTPLVESHGVTPPLGPHERLVTFLWRGATHGVRLFSGPSNDHDALQRLAGTDIWYRSYRLPDHSRLAYQLAPDVPVGQGRRAILATAQQDPLNPKVSTLAVQVQRDRADTFDRPDPFQTASLLELPNAPSSGWTQAYPGRPRGVIERHRLASAHLGNERDIHLYRSPGYTAGAASNRLVVVFDADRYLGDVPLPTVLDNLVAEGRLPGVAAIFIANPTRDSRGRELPPNAAFAAFMSDELMPWAVRRGVRAEARHTVIAGASYGGLAAAWVASQHPQWFGNVYSQSGSFWWSPTRVEGEAPEWLTRQWAVWPKRPLRFRLEAGLFERGRGGVPGILETTRHLRDVLQAKGYEVTHREHAGGHDNAQWREAIGPALLDLLGEGGEAARAEGR